MQTRAARACTVVRVVPLAKFRREGMDALFLVALHVHAGVIDVKRRNPQRNANGDGQDGRRPKELGTPGQQARNGPQPWTSAAMATQAPAGASPKQSPNQKWHPT